MESVIKKEFSEQCKLFFNRKIKQFIMGKTIKIYKVNKRDGTNYMRTEKTPWPINEISKRSAKLICRKLMNNG